VERGVNLLLTPLVAYRAQQDKPFCDGYAEQPVENLLRAPNRRSVSLKIRADSSVDLPGFGALTTFFNRLRATFRRRLAKDGGFGGQRSLWSRGVVALRPLQSSTIREHDLESSEPRAVAPR